MTASVFPEPRGVYYIRYLLFYLNYILLKIILHYTFFNRIQNMTLQSVAYVIPSIKMELLHKLQLIWY